MAITQMMVGGGAPTPLPDGKRRPFCPVCVLDDDDRDEIEGYQRRGRPVPWDTAIPLGLSPAQIEHHRADCLTAKLNSEAVTRVVAGREHLIREAVVKALSDVEMVALRDRAHGELLMCSLGAVRALNGLLDEENASPSVRLKAAVAILDRVGLGPSTAVQLSGEVTVSTDRDSLLSRVGELRERLASRVHELPAWSATEVAPAGDGLPAPTADDPVTGLAGYNAARHDKVARAAGFVDVALPFPEPQDLGVVGGVAAAVDDDGVLPPIEILR